VNILPGDITGCRCPDRLYCWPSLVTTTASGRQDSQRSTPLYK